MMKVSLYIRNHSSRKSEKAKPQKIYPMGTIYVLRYGTTWETLKGDHTYQTAKTAAMRKESDLFAGVVEKPSPKPKPKPKPKPDVRTLDEVVNIYLTTGKAAQENWRKHTMQCYTLGSRTPAMPGRRRTKVP